MKQPSGMIVNIKKLVRRFIPAKKYHRSYSQEGEDMLLRRIFHSKTRGCFIDIGACHPILHSNTYSFYKRGWRGIN